MPTVFCLFFKYAELRSIDVHCSLGPCCGLPTRNTAIALSAAGSFFADCYYKSFRKQTFHIKDNLKQYVWYSSAASCTSSSSSEQKTERITASENEAPQHTATMNDVLCILRTLYPTHTNTDQCCCCSLTHSVLNDAVSCSTTMKSTFPFTLHITHYFTHLFTTSISDFFKHSSSRFTTVLDGISFTIFCRILIFVLTQHHHKGALTLVEESKWILSHQQWMHNENHLALFGGVTHTRTKNAPTHCNVVCFAVHRTYVEAAVAANLVDCKDVLCFANYDNPFPLVYAILFAAG